MDRFMFWTVFLLLIVQAGRPGIERQLTFDPRAAALGYHQVMRMRRVYWQLTLAAGAALQGRSSNPSSSGPIKLGACSSQTPHQSNRSEHMNERCGFPDI